LPKSNSRNRLRNNSYIIHLLVNIDPNNVAT
jgi:hypothetical protein